MVDERFKIIPQTGQMVIARDTLLSREAIKHGTICLDGHIVEIPEIKQVIKPGAVALDIGAFIGGVTRTLLDAGFRTYSVEAQPDAYVCLVHNCPETKAVNVIVGDGQPMEYQQFEPEDQNYGSRRATKSNGSNAALSMTLDMLFYGLPRIDFIKMDVEGSECAALDGAKLIIDKFRPVMLIEINRTQLGYQGLSDEDLIWRLKGLGYRMYAVQPEREGTDDPWDAVCVPN
jgi:FkbM family methyltransferase